MTTTPSKDPLRGLKKPWVKLLLAVLSSVWAAMEFSQGSVIWGAAAVLMIVLLAIEHNASRTHPRPTDDGRD
ncbi:MAG: hypothetical protein VX589_08980 [Myxococcota bacterium]|nr:hypothetical protein [Myxococcota bacterium]